MLQIRPAPLQQSQNSNMRYQVDLEMNLPHALAKLSDERLKRWQMLWNGRRLQTQQKAAAPASSPADSRSALSLAVTEDGTNPRFAAR